MFYNKYFRSNYEELITYYPKFYREVLEMRAILEAEGKLADDIEDSIEQVFNNCFIDTADEDTISKLESFLMIQAIPNRSVQERRMYIKSHFISVGKISASSIANMIKAYTGGDSKISFEPYDDENNNCLYIDLPYFEGTLYAKDIEKIIDKTVPAHIPFQVRLQMSDNSGLYPINTLFPHIEIYPKSKEAI